MSECLFCRMIKGDIPCRKVYEDDNVFAFEDINPQAPVHILVIPKKHVASLAEAEAGDAPLLGELLLRAGELARGRGLDGDGFRVVVNTGPEAGQSVFHIHVHLLGGRRMAWPPG